ncbi:Flp pilus assembly complex ATPase component TadA [Cereibacter sphaeroides]|uniref:type IV pilus twitching motility protein PilT n=1 Tax=Cereibacter sphaeroides TaxID=1063 RepID=UPI001F2B55CA|nr:ATPase, T2SS/T4P/T4SS family [Cereibacter sphaeroides]MCE6959682.1 Flp pilus assembly complex ATPase component TadA [Cereibacter sphaeroides]MCE6974457.1 Flp pilus assembly complex ATPase component TadA [Cereibacter sphaeroides]
MSPAKSVPHVASRRFSPGVERAAARPLDRESLTALMLPEEPQRLSAEDFRQLLMSCVMSGATDITVQSDQQPRAEIHNVLYRAMRRPLAPSEVDLILTEVYGAANGKTEINGQRVLDFSYELNLPDGERRRFRVNATGILASDISGVEITLRSLPDRTPDLALVQISQAEIEALAPRDGIVVIAGATGSGKSTTMAAITRYHLENVRRPVKIVDIQAPIEYTFHDVTSRLTGSASIIGSSEVGRHVPDFFEGVRSALRRKPNIINVGEARDFETISTSITASLTGHLVYTTTHAGSVPDAMRRLLTIFPGNEREARGYDLVSALRFLMVQHLVPRIDRPGRIPVREYLRFTTRVREALLSAPISSWPSMVADEVAGRVKDLEPEDMRQSLVDVAGARYREGVISRDDALFLGGPRAVKDPA